MEKEKRTSRGFANIRKRVTIGLATAIFMFVPNITNTTKASIGSYHYPFHNYSSIHNRVHWSPQAHSLVPGNLKYHPSALKYGHSGLVPRNVRWNPYAFSYKRSGLVADDHWSYTGFLHDPHHHPYDPHHHPHDPHNNLYNLPLTVIHHTHIPCVSNPSNLFSKIKQNSQQKINSRKARIQAVKSHRAEINKIKENDGRELISKYLKNKDIEFKTDRIFSRENKTLSANFVFRDKKTIIKYLDPEERLSLAQQPEYVRTLFKNYKKRWEDFCKENNKKEDKWKIHTIESSDKERTLSKLESIIKTNF